MSRKQPIPHLTLRDNGFYYISYRGAGKTPGSTRQINDSTGTKDALEAQEIFARWIIERRKPIEPALTATSPEAIAQAQAAVTVNDCWDRYQAEHLDNKLPGAKKVETGDELKRLWTNYLSEFFGEMTIAEVGQKATDRYVTIHTNGSIRSIKPHSVRKELELLRAIINWGAKKPNALFSVDLVQPFELPLAGHARDRWLTDDEMKRLFTAAAKRRPNGKLTRVERFLWIALYTAARMEAITELTWDRVHFKTGQIFFDVPGRDTTDKGRAVVAISKQLRPVLERAFEERTSSYVVGSGAVWDSIQRVVYDAGLAKPGYVPPQGKDKATATGISPHTFRHTAATHMAQNGVPLWDIANILGNSLAMVEKVYAKWQVKNAALNVDRIGAGDMELID